MDFEDDEQAIARTEPTPRRGYLKRHWRGDFSLGYAYWVNGAGISIALIVLIASVSQQANSHFGSAAWLFAMSGLLLILPAVAFWQFVGIWRSADLHASRGGRAGWAIAAKLAIVLGALQSLPVFGAIIPVVREAYTMATGDKFGAATFRLVRNGTEPEFSGGINSGLHNEFIKFLDAAPQLRVIHLSSRGGRVVEAELIAKEVKRRRLNTYVSSSCLSACTEIFLAGATRWASKWAKIGFHSPSFPGLDESAVRDVRERTVTYLTSQGVDRRFAERAVSVKSDSMWYPTIEEMKSAGVLTGVADSGQFAASNLAVFSDTQTARLGMEKIPMFAAMRDVYPQEYDQLIKMIADGYKDGDTEQAILARARLMVNRLVARSLPSAPPGVIIQFGMLTLTYLQYLRDIDAESCVAYLEDDKGATMRVDAATRFPDLFAQEIALKADIIRNAAHSAAEKVTEKDVAADQAEFVADLRRLFGAKITLLKARKISPADFDTYCRMNIEFYRYALALPGDRSVRFLRFTADNS